ncbi:uncharacterized protein LOC131943568 [Physella acuta]|uniref:uncharacterized protein LOC131943568 n=1 Tax=Physella acuta TaxID=109671 RepID=UPI0027DE6E2C|nr:uncharacterized protein LOC131943568 [Physella acuta]
MLKEGLYEAMETDEKTNHGVPSLPGQPKETSWGQRLCGKIYLALVIPLCALVRSIVSDVIYIVLMLLEVYISLRLLGTFGLLYKGESLLLGLIYSACCANIVVWINERVLGEFVKWCLKQETYFHRIFTSMDCSAHRQYTGERLKCGNPAGCRDYDLILGLEKKIKNKSMVQLDDVIQRYAWQKLLKFSNLRGEAWR